MNLPDCKYDDGEWLELKFSMTTFRLTLDDERLLNQNLYGIWLIRCLYARTVRRGSFEPYVRGYGGGVWVEGRACLSDFW